MSRKPSLQTIALRMAREGMQFTLGYDENGNLTLVNGLTELKSEPPIAAADEEAQEADRAFNVAFGQGLRGA